MQSNAVPESVSSAASQTAPASGSAQPGQPGVYVPVQGGGENRSGETLLVEAYVVLWIILMGWLFMLWRKQARIHARLDELEKVLDQAAAKGGAAASKGSAK